MQRFNLIEYFCLHRKFLIYNLILRGLKIRYRKSFFGMLWTLLIPAGSAAIYYLVFHYVLKITIPNYLLFIICGIVPWSFFATTTSGCVEVLVGNYGLLNKVPLPIHSLVLAEALTHFLNLVLGLPVIFLIFLFSDVAFNLATLQYIPLVFILFLTSYGIGLIFSLAYVYLRDLKYLVTLITQFWFYLTPVMYEVKMIPEKWAHFLHLNPIGFLFAGFHKSIMGQYLTIHEWLSITMWCLIINIIAFSILKKVRFNIVEIL